MTDSSVTVSYSPVQFHLKSSFGNWTWRHYLSNEYEKVIILSEASGYYSNEIGIQFAQLYNSTLETKQSSKLISENMLVGSGP